MENFIFYYTLFCDFDLAIAKLKEDTTQSQDFLSIAKKICELEAQSFLSGDSKIALQKHYKNFYEQTQQFKNVHLSEEEWRLYAGLMCTLAEWCEDTQFFKLSSEKQKFIFPENPVDGYFNVIQIKNHEHT